MLRYNISVDQFLLERPTGKNTQRRQLDVLLDGMGDDGSLLDTYASFMEDQITDNERDLTEQETAEIKRQCDLLRAK